MKWLGLFCTNQLNVFNLLNSIKNQLCFWRWFCLEVHPSTEIYICIHIIYTYIYSHSDSIDSFYLNPVGVSMVFFFSGPSLSSLSPLSSHYEQHKFSFNAPVKRRRRWHTPLLFEQQQDVCLFSLHSFNLTLLHSLHADMIIYYTYYIIEE